MTNILYLIKEEHQLVSPRSMDRHDSVDKACFNMRSINNDPKELRQKEVSQNIKR